MQRNYPVHRADITTVALLANPHAGSGSAASVADKARQRFHERDINVVVLQGRSVESARKLCREAVADPRCHALVVCGGDGMMHLALQEQAGSDTPLGIIPAGTGNDLARILAIPSDPREAADVVADGLVAQMDLGRMSSVAEQPRSEWFATVACAGIDALISARANAMSWPTGSLRYTLATAIEFARFKPRAAYLELDDGTVFEGPVSVLSVGNTSTYGGGMQICPNADVTDGELDITVMGDIGRLKIALNFRKVYEGSFTDTEQGLHTFRSRKLRVNVDGITVNADGDPIAPLPMDIEAVPGAGTILVSAPPAHTPA